METTVIGVRDNKEYLEKAIDFFSAKWGIERNIYVASTISTITGS